MVKRNPHARIFEGPEIVPDPTHYERCMRLLSDYFARFKKSIRDRKLSPRTHGLQRRFLRVREDDFFTPSKGAEIDTNSWEARKVAAWKRDKRLTADGRLLPRRSERGKQAARAVPQARTIMRMFDGVSRRQALEVRRFLA